MTGAGSERIGHDGASAVRELAPVLEIARVELHGEAPPDVDAEGRARLLAVLRSPAPLGVSQRLKRLVSVRMVAALAAVAVAALIAFWFWPAPPLSFSIDGTRVAAAGAPVGADSREAQLTFGDGSRVTFSAGANGRVADVTSRGARIVMAQGHAHFDVVHQAGASWSVEAGRYVVRVTGTAFDVDWTPSQGRLRVSLLRGSVVVEGTNTSVTLGAGQVLDIDPAGAVYVRDLPGACAGPSAGADSACAPSRSLDADPSGASVDPTPGSSGEPPAASPATSAASGEAVPSANDAKQISRAAPESWPHRVSRGDYAGVLDEASSKGLVSVIDGASLDDLSALAEAARYLGKTDVARQALEGLRKRFPGSSAGHTATFLLGRIAEDSEGSASKAISLYDEYLESGGPFAAEALGRKMVAVNRTSGSKAAEAIARDYLSRYPKGSYAGAAERILGEP